MNRDRITGSNKILNQSQHATGKTGLIKSTISGPKEKIQNKLNQDNMHQLETEK